MLNTSSPTHVADQPENEEPLTPNHLLLHRTYVNLLPGVFESSDKPQSVKSWEEYQSEKPHMEEVAGRIPPYSSSSREVVACSTSATSR